MGMISEFKEFISRGNVVDLAVGVVIGAAFGKIVTALVDGIVMPADRRVHRGRQRQRLEVRDPACAAGLGRQGSRRGAGDHATARSSRPSSTSC